MTEFNQSGSSTLMRDVVALGKKYAKCGFPNAHRDGCPNRTILRAMAYRDRHLELRDLPVSHVVGCSPCFQQYAHFRRMSFVLRGFQLSAASLVLLSMIFVTVRLVRNHTSRSGQLSIPEKRLAERQPSVETKPTLRSPDPLPLRVNLASFSPTRGDANDDSKDEVHLPLKLLRVNFILPLGMEAGEYTIRLQEAGGAVVTEQRALGHMKQGVTSVQVDIDLSDGHRGHFALIIRPPGLSWRRFPVVVE